MNQLEQLKRYSTVVADSGDIRQLAGDAPRDASTNPSLILQAAQQAESLSILREVVAAHRTEPAEAIVDPLLVRFGREILGIVTDRVSTAIDARLSFDSAASVARARRVMALYEDAGIGRERVLIQLAATWEGIQAARILEHEGIHCNMTLLFACCQAVACADSSATRVSPFVGSILDWHRTRAGAARDAAAPTAEQDPGVQSVARIYTYYKKFGIDTEVMAASLRSVAQVHALAGCDLLALSPEILGELKASDAPLPRALDPHQSCTAPIHALTFNESSFRYALNDDAIASEKLGEGIRAFAADAVRLDALIEGLR
jgi:transaldolase